MNNEQLEMVMERLDFIEFRQELLFTNTGLDRSLFEYKITRKQYREIMDVMDEFRTKIDSGESCSNGEFESKIYAIVPSCQGDYHMCEELAKGFMDDRRWEEVFIELYGDLPKYSYLKNE